MMRNARPDTYYGEVFRPRYHFSPERGWMNDPNGLVYYDGEYHLFYQYLPQTIEHHGHKTWGHAASPDLVHWQHHPPALYPDQLGAIWSGSAVVDWNDTSGFRSGGHMPLVAVFSQDDEGHQQQSIAYSTDRGRSWTMYAGNPVIANPGIPDFRDPKVFWHAESKHWVMVLAAGDRVMIYSSADLKDWTLASAFGQAEGSHGGVWECPDLFELAVDGDASDTRWVLVVSVGDGAPNGGSGTQYFVGDFDGRQFTNHHAPDSVLWLDYGRDNYAGVTFSDIPSEDGRRILIGWMSNWVYAGVVPTTPWRGAMTVPRELVLTTAFSDEPQVASLPIAELDALQGHHLRLEKTPISDSFVLPLSDEIRVGAFEVQVELELGTASQCGLAVGNGSDSETIIGYDIATQQAFVDRSRSGLVDFHPHFGGQHATPPETVLPLPGTKIVSLRILVDRSSVEVFANGGSVVLTEQIFPTGAYDRLEFFARHGTATLNRCDVWELESIWNK